MDGVAEFVRCKHWLVNALAEAGGEITIDDVAAAIGKGKMHFWPGKECACVTEVAEFPRKRYLNVTLAGGRMDEILSMIPSFKAWAHKLGCDKITVAGRVGWERVLRPLGWKKDLVVLSVPVEGQTGENV